MGTVRIANTAKTGDERADPQPPDDRVEPETDEPLSRSMQRPRSALVTAMVHPKAIDRALGRSAQCPRQTVKRRRVEVAGPEIDATADRVPVPRVTAKDVSLDPREIFVLSFVDGVLDAAEISDIVGLPRPKVDAILERLALFGCIDFEE